MSVEPNNNFDSIPFQFTCSVSRFEQVRAVLERRVETSVHLCLHLHIIAQCDPFNIDVDLVVCEIESHSFDANTRILSTLMWTRSTYQLGRHQFVSCFCSSTRPSFHSSPSLFFTFSLTLSLSLFLPPRSGSNTIERNELITNSVYAHSRQMCIIWDGSPSVARQLRQCKDASMMYEHWTTRNLKMNCFKLSPISNVPNARSIPFRSVRYSILEGMCLSRYLLLSIYV